MNKYFKSAIVRFKERFDKEFKINPISQEDAQIIVELKEILRKNGIEDVKEILEDYKFLADKEISDKLMQYNIDNPDIIDEMQKQSEPKRDFIIAKGERIELNYIFGYKIKIKKDFTTYDNKYFILLNPTPPEVNKIPMYGNYLILMDSEIEMNKYALVLDELLKGKNCSFLDIDEEF